MPVEPMPALAAAVEQEVHSRRSYTFNRRMPRTSESHNKAENPKLFEDMRKIFAERFEERQGSHVKSSEIFEIFARSRELSTKEEALFMYHYKKLFHAQWTNAKYIRIHNQRCFLHVCIK
jgi:hypothetical protein